MKSFYDLTRAERIEQMKAFMQTEYGKSAIIGFVLNTVVFIVGIICLAAFSLKRFTFYGEPAYAGLEFTVYFSLLAAIAGILGMCLTELEFKSNLIRWYEKKKK